ncbi:MAG TPA: hypothetical protein EYQ50_22480 [Verrucomicrobiales bacterium]|nr:hypothetical protein [Verrucomicrobiales bacterium]
MNHMGELVDEYVLRGVGIAREAEDVLFGGADDRGSTEAAGASIPINLGFHVALLREVGGEFVPGHGDEADVVAGESGQDVISSGTHPRHDPGRFTQGEVGEVGRSDYRHLGDGDLFLVEPVEVEGFAKIVRDGSGGGDSGFGCDAAR